MAELREEIISKSFVQFLTRGYKACSLKDLEQATGLTKGAFYYYFKDKKEILKAGIEKYFTVMREIGDKELVQISSLREFFGLVLQYKEESADLSKKLFNTYVIEVLFFQLVLEVSSLFPEFRERIYGISKNRLACWEYIILKAKEKGEIRETLDTSVLAKNLMSVSISMLNLKFEEADMKFVFSDMRMQFEQYYLLIKR
ncbi:MULTISPECIES: TetR/AcrR family transcriptional regulator [Porphyromonadaceae]|uniref:TetR family transcriptional regulator n=1 Tax=Sanguibacteroides justesenii TaxID=1547597 RepID=A0AB34R6A8_9PORP|nr:MULTISPECIES: TetR/AcrR family transcriptional regulator [Porphyromonadaceae]KIO45151.1 TetR family transcriptional regulator [Sanguibacteroides justesenii]PXZ44445.1 TetR/AcrR family transcriptional regulator [Sanguibacteroides justesenii]